MNTKIDVKNIFDCKKEKLNSLINKKETNKDADTITVSAIRKLKKLDFLFGIFILVHCLILFKFSVLIIYIPISVIFSASAGFFLLISFFIKLLIVLGAKKESIVNVKIFISIQKLFTSK